MRIRRRRVAIFAVAAVGALAAAGAALAITNNASQVNFKFSPNTGLSKTAFKSGQIFVHTHTDFAHPGDKAHGGFVNRVQLYFDNDFKFNPGSVPVCNQSLANTNEKQAMAKCGTALVGKGTAQATSTAGATIPGCVIAFNGPKQGTNPTIILHSRFVISPPCPNPSTSTAGTVDAILTGILKPANKAGFGKMLDVPNIDTQPLPLKDFTTTVKRGSYVQARCSASPWRLQTKFTYSGTGQTPDTVNSTQACSN
ncbi:MAG: hypothetical protein ACJ75I_02980 [Solirubrobacterales bacterium]